MKSITTKKRITQSQTTDLTRFGLNAYVLGAINGEIYLWKMITIALSLFENARVLRATTIPAGYKP